MGEVLKYKTLKKIGVKLIAIREGDLSLLETKINEKALLLESTLVTSTTAYFISNHTFYINNVLH